MQPCSEPLKQEHQLNNKTSTFHSCSMAAMHEPLGTKTTENIT